MSKILMEDCKNISIYKLRDWGYLKGGLYGGTITWTYRQSGKKNDISFTLNLENGGGYVIFNYTITDRDKGEKENINQEYPIVSTPCNYGGVRYWLICSIYNKSVYCGRRVAKLYLGAGSHYFACRHCYNLTYESRNVGGRQKPFGKIISFLELEEMKQGIKRYYYKSKETKKYQRYLRKSTKAEMSCYTSVMGLSNKRFDKKH